MAAAQQAGAARAEGLGRTRLAVGEDGGVHALGDRSDELGDARAAVQLILRTGATAQPLLGEVLGFSLSWPCRRVGWRACSDVLQLRATRVAGRVLSVAAEFLFASQGTK